MVFSAPSTVVMLINFTGGNNLGKLALACTAREMGNIVPAWRNKGRPATSKQATIPLVAQLGKSFVRPGWLNSRCNALRNLVAGEHPCGQRRPRRSQKLRYGFAVSAKRHSAEPTTQAS